MVLTEPVIKTVPNVSCYSYYLLWKVSKKGEVSIRIFELKYTLWLPHYSTLWTLRVILVAIVSLALLTTTTTKNMCVSYVYKPCKFDTLLGS